MGGEFFEFGAFQLHPGKRTLLRGGKELRLGARAFDILVTLVEHAGTVVGKDELIATVWPGLHVEEGNLRVHVTALRKILGDAEATGHLIATVPGRGYCFGAVPTKKSDERSGAFRTLPPSRNLPMPANRVVGRELIVNSLIKLSSEWRVMTIVGPGGIGKTTVGLQAADAIAGNLNHEAVFLDLTVLSDPGLLPGTLASALGCTIQPSNPVEDLAAFIGSRRILLVLDSCEHILAELAPFVERLLGKSPGLRVLATSREPLRIPSEWVCRLPPLAVPPSTQKLTVQEALRFSSVQLFVERTSACLGGYALSDADAPIVAAICRRLDGNALAIELAASGVDAVGVHGLAKTLADPSRLLHQQRRSGARRHRTLQATIDWSYGLLSDEEKAVLRRMAVFNGCFSLEAARAIACGDDIPGRNVEESVMALVAKSLVAAEIGMDPVAYRLLDTTRAYAWDALQKSGERDEIECRHAEYFRIFFEAASKEWGLRPTSEWLDLYASQIGNLRRALDWAYLPGGRPDIGVALIISSLPLWGMALIDRSTPWEAVLDINGGTPSGLAPLEMAERIDDINSQLCYLWTLWIDCKNKGHSREGLVIANKFSELAAKLEASADRFVGQRLHATSLHVLGRHAEARAEIEHMLDNYVRPPQGGHAVRLQFDVRTTARNTLARVLCVQGFSARSLEIVEENINYAVSTGDILLQNNVLADAACPIAFMLGDPGLCAKYTELLEEQSRIRALDVGMAFAQCYRGKLLVLSGDPLAGVELLQAGVQKLDRARFLFHQTEFLGALAHGFLNAGQVSNGLTAILDALARCEGTGEGWYLPELHRIRGEVLLAHRSELSLAAEAAFETATAVAREQDAISWELRAAISLAKMRLEQRRIDEARSSLRSVYERFPKGANNTPDLASALKLLDGPLA